MCYVICEINADFSMLSILQTSTVQTPQGQAYEGRRFSGKGVFQRYLNAHEMYYYFTERRFSFRSQVCPFSGLVRPWSLL